MQTMIDASGGVKVLHFRGRLTADRHDERLPDLVRRQIGQGYRRLILDLRDISYMDSTCLRELIEAFTMAAQCGGELKVVNVPPRVQRLLDLSGLTDLLFEPGQDEATRHRRSR